MDSLINEVVCKLIDKRNEVVNNLIIKGLEKQGFYFNEDKQLHDFIKENCSVSHHEVLEGDLYGINNKPFLFISTRVNIGSLNDLSHSYKISNELEYKFINNA